MGGWEVSLRSTLEPGQCNPRLGDQWAVTTLPLTSQDPLSNPRRLPQAGRSAEVFWGGGGGCVLALAHGSQLLNLQELGKLIVKHSHCQKLSDIN